MFRDGFGRGIAAVVFYTFVTMAAVLCLIWVIALIRAFNYAITH